MHSMYLVSVPSLLCAAVLKETKKAHLSNGGPFSWNQQRKFAEIERTLHARWIKELHSLHDNRQLYSLVWSGPKYQTRKNILSEWRFLRWDIRCDGELPYNCPIEIVCILNQKVCSSCNKWLELLIYRIETWHTLTLSTNLLIILKDCCDLWTIQKDIYSWILDHQSAQWYEQCFRKLVSNWVWMIPSCQKKTAWNFK